MNNTKAAGLTILAYLQLLLRMYEPVANIIEHVIFFRALTKGIRTPSGYQSKLFDPKFLRSKDLPVPWWLERRLDIKVPYEKV